MLTVPPTYKFPQDPLLVRLLETHHHKGKGAKIIIHDIHGFHKSYGELLGDILETARLVRADLIYLQLLSMKEDC